MLTARAQNGRGTGKGPEAGREDLRSRAKEKQQELDLGVTGRGAVPWEQGEVPYCPFHHTSPRQDPDRPNSS